MPRETGFVISYKPDRGFGFIESPAYEKQIFFHIRAVEDHELNDFLKQQTENYLALPVEVSFWAQETEKGPQASQIHSVEFEHARDTVLKIRQFINSADLSSQEFEDSFTKLVSLKMLSRFGNDPDLRNLAVKRLVESIDKWDAIITIAQEWSMATQQLKRSLVVSSKKQLGAFAEKLLSLIGFEILSRTEVDPTIPYFQQFIKPPDCPLDAFRNIAKWSFYFLPNEDTLDEYSKLRPSLFISTKDEIKIIVLLEENANLKGKKPNLAILRQANILRSLTINEPDKSIMLGRLFRTIFPKTNLQPFGVGSTYNETMFAGRSQERERILSKPGSNFAVYGGRRIGKTWFLQDLCRKCEEDPYQQIYTPLYVSLQSAKTSENAITLVQEAIDFKFSIDAPVQLGGFSALRNRLIKIHKNSKKVVLIALDEIDGLLEADDVEFFEQLRQMWNTYPDVFKFVFAGFKHLIYSFTRLTDNRSGLDNHPLANWVGDGHFPLGCLSEDDISSLVSIFRWTGVNFNQQELVNKIYDLTSGHPYYVHSLCQSVASGIFDRNLRAIESDDVEKYATEKFFVDVFQIFTKNLSAMQMLIGKVFLDRDIEFSESDIRNALKERFGIDLSEDQIADEMTVLQACSVFSRGAKGYKPVMQRINREFFSHKEDEDLALRFMLGQRETEND